MKHLAIDQYGGKYLLSEHPRKELLALLGMSKAEKMYVDGPDGQASHVGYVIGGLWLRIYKLTPWEGGRQ